MWADIFSFGRDDVGKLLADIKTEQALQRRMLINQGNLLGVIMALASIEQSVLDELGNTLGSVADGVQAIIDDPSNDLGPADLTAVTAGVARLQALIAQPEVPVDENPDLPPVDGGGETPPAEPAEPTV